MRTIIGLSFLALTMSAFAAGRDLRYFNVVPVRGGDVEFAAREVKRQTALGMKAIAVSLSYHPQCTPAANLLPVHAEKFRRLKALLADTDVEVGVLVQSTAGHGWNGRMQLSKEPWQRTVHTSGFVGPRYCQLDPGFRAYILEAVRSICREGPSFLLIDDDFGPRNGEGFCPLHVALYNDATGETRTAAEWGKLAEEGELSDPVRRKMEEARRQVPIAFAREIRKAIDSVDPRIRCGMCTPGKGMGFTREVALALAGPDTKPFIRVCNAVYGIQHPTAFINQFKHVRQLVSMFDGVEEIVAEADTWPQNYWSEPARFFSAHLIFDVLFGLDGAKIWMSEFERAQDVGSQARYERVFRDELPKRQALYDLMRTQHPRFHGVTGVINWEDWSSDSMKHGAWDNDTPAREVFMPFGFPCEFAKPGLTDPRNVYALTRADVQKMTDGEVRAVLAHRAYVDAAGAKELTKRGFAKLIGVEATDGGEDFFYNCELPTDGAKPLGMMWTETSACLKPLSDKVEVLSEFAYRDPFMKHPDRKAPALTYFRNARGGEVAVSGWTFENGGWNAWARYLKVARKEQLVKVMDRLAGGFMPFTACENNHALTTWATLDDGSTLVTLTNLAVDDWQDLRVRLDKVPASAKLLQDDGTWKPVKAEKTGADEVTFRVGEVRCLVPNILRLNTP